MTLLEIEAFLAVVKYGNISLAAKELYVTQPTLSKRIKIMENELGYSGDLAKKMIYSVKYVYGVV